MTTEQPTIGGTLQGTWFATSLSELIPGPIMALGTIAQGLEPVLTALQISLNVTIGVQTVVALLPELPTLVDLALQAATIGAIELTVQLVNSLRSSGQSFIIIPPTPGGFRGTAGVIKNALLNTSDPRRPNFGPFSFVGGWGIIAAADVLVIETIVANIKALFLSVQGLADQAGYIKTTTTLTFPDPFAANKVAGLAAKQNVPPWVAARIVDLIPGAENALDALIAALRSLKPPPISLPMTDYLIYVNKVLARIRAILAIITAIVALLQVLFIDIPVKIIEWDGQAGGTQDIVDSLPAWFSPTQGILSDVPDNLYTCGIFSVVGSVEPATPTLQMSIMQSLFLPTPTGGVVP